MTLHCRAQHRLIEHVVVVGENRPFVGALVTLDEEELTRWSLDRERSLTPAEAAKDPAVLETIQEAVDRVNEDVSRAESIRRIRILDHAVVPHRPFKDNRNFYLLLGIVGGFGLSVAGVILAASVLEVPILAAARRDSSVAGGRAASAASAA